MRFRRDARRSLLPVDFHNDAGMQVAPSPVFPLPLTPLSRQVAILVVPFLQVAAVSAIFLLVINMVIATVPIIVSPVPCMVVVVMDLYGRDRDKQGSAQPKCTGNVSSGCSSPFGCSLPWGNILSNPVNFDHRC